jgi:hypothetical protein
MTAWTVVLMAPLSMPVLIMMHWATVLHIRPHRTL